MELENQSKPVMQVSVPMPDELEQELRIMAANLRLSRAELIRQIIIKYLPLFKEEIENTEAK